MTNTKNLEKNGTNPTTATKIGRDEINKALNKLGIKAHADMFEISPEMGPDSFYAVCTVLTGYMQCIIENNAYMEDVCVDCPYEDCDTDEYLDSVYSIIRSLGDDDRITKCMEWAFFNEILPSAKYSLHRLANSLVGEILLAKDISSQFFFAKGPLEGFFEDLNTSQNLTQTVKAGDVH